MPKKLPEDLSARITAEIARHPEGVGIDDLHATLVDFVSRRTLQRRLADLVEHERIQIKGEGRAVRYLPVTGMIEAANSVQVNTSSAGEIEIYVPTSREGAEVRAYVCELKGPGTQFPSYFHPFRQNHRSYE